MLFGVAIPHIRSSVWWHRWERTCQSIVLLALIKTFYAVSLVFTSVWIHLLKAKAIFWYSIITRLIKWKCELSRWLCNFWDWILELSRVEYEWFLFLDNFFSLEMVIYIFLRCHLWLKVRWTLESKLTVTFKMTQHVVELALLVVHDISMTLFVSIS